MVGPCTAPDGAGRYPPPVSQTRGASGAAGPTAGGTGLRVLVADDFEPVRTLAIRMVEQLGAHLVDEAGDGVEAVAALGAASYDLLLLDLSMPRMGGLEVVRWINERDLVAGGLTVVVISASAHDERAALLELGVSRVLPKPFRLPEIADVVADVAARRRES